VKQSIGVIDSGVGGLTVAQELMRQLPHERLIYLGDTKRCPYGSRSEEEVRAFTWEMVRFLLHKEIKLLVVACNTATAFTIDELKEQLDIPVIGVINPGARAAINASENKNIAVIGTEGTIKSKSYVKALQQIDANLDVYPLACPTLVPMVEQGIFSGDQAVEVAEYALEPLQPFHAFDTLILGCTHYPLIKDVIQHVVGDHVNIVSSSEETARETSALLDVMELLNTDVQHVIHEFYTTGDLKTFTEMAKKIFDENNSGRLNIHYEFARL